ncbi:phage major capsid protein [Moraxella catarrhalis]|uniref:phage major capsid protein n=1 Tax=Moraxella catarrhalis TaxID=480 RepID=UPI001EEE7AC7|nr:phage major capsid protein [Moraxella catarrhalis]MCG6817010.1 phage major capsid protein [Moraxella catarrhalis]
MNFQEQLAKVKATIAIKQKQIGDTMTKAAKDNRTVNDDEEAQIKACEDDIEKLEKNAQRLNTLIQAEQMASSATQVAGQNPEQAEASAVGAPIPEPESTKSPATVKDNLDKGIGFALLVKASTVATTSKGGITTREVLQGWGAPDSVIRAATQKAVIGTTTDDKFGKELIDYAHLTGEFIELVRQKTVVDTIAPLMRQVPFNVKIPMQTAAGSVGWVGEGKMKPVGNPEFGSMTLSHAKIAGIVLLSDELIRFSNPKADTLVRDDLVATVAQFIDQQFFDPDKTEAAESPASVLNGVTAITATGTTADKIDTDTNTLIAQLVDAGISLEGAVWAMSETRAMQISGMRDALGRIYFEGMNLTGTRSLKGLPVHTSGSLGDKIVLIVPSQILLADDGGVDFSVSGEATINMGTDDAPKMVNLFQNNLTAIRAERFIRWKPRMTKAVGYIKYTG